MIDSDDDFDSDDIPHLLLVDMENQISWRFCWTASCDSRSHRCSRHPSTPGNSHSIPTQQEIDLNGAFLGHNLLWTLDIDTSICPGQDIW